MVLQWNITLKECLNIAFQYSFYFLGWTTIVDFSASALDWHPSFVGLKTAKVYLPFVMFLLETWIHDIPGAKGAKYPVYGDLRLQCCQSLSQHMILQHPRLLLTSPTSWPSLLASGWTLQRLGSVTCFTKDCLHVRSCEICFILADLPLNSTEHTDICQLAFQNGRLNEPTSVWREIFILTSHWDFRRLKTEALEKSVKSVYSIQEAIIKFKSENGLFIEALLDCGARWNFLPHNCQKRFAMISPQFILPTLCVCVCVCVCVSVSVFLACI